LHHEDFTGQYGKFWASFQNTAWYQAEVREAEAMAIKHGFKKVSELKLAVAKKIRDYVAGGGFLFAMCSATDSYDIALAADGVDICEGMFDGDPADPSADNKLNFNNMSIHILMQLRKLARLRNKTTYLLCLIFRQNGMWCQPCCAKTTPK